MKAVTVNSPWAFETPFTNRLNLTYGPLDLLGRYFFRAEQTLAALGLVLSFCQFDELVAVNHANADSWRPLLPSFDPTQSSLTEDSAFCLCVRNASGEIVATQAAKLFVWTDTNFFEEAASMRLFYRDPAKSRVAGETCNVTAELTRGIDGRVMFSGGAWFRPDLRGKGLGLLLPRIARYYAFSLWYTDFTTSIQAEAVAKSAFSKRVGHCHVDWALDLENMPVLRSGSVRAAAMWTDAAELMADLEIVLSEIDRTKIDRSVENVGGQHGDAIRATTHNR
jgi:hypothetical protein